MPASCAGLLFILTAIPDDGLIKETFRIYNQKGESAISFASRSMRPGLRAP